MGFFKKLTKPISKVLDKIVPNEVKPYLPYLAAFAPYLPAMQGIMGIGGNTMLSRALMSGGLNLSAQLAQEGSEGEFSGLSTLLAAGQGALTAPGTPGITGVDKFGSIEVPYSTTGTPSAGDYLRGVSDTGSFTDKALEFTAAGADKLQAITAAGVEDPFSMAGLKAAALPISHGTADLAMADARRALQDYEDEMAGTDDPLYSDDGRRRAIRAAMEAAGHLEDTILDALESLGLKEGGIVGLKDGGQLVKRGPGRPGYNGQGDYTPDRSPGRSAPGGGAGRDILTGQRNIGQTVAKRTTPTIDQNQLRKNIDLKGIMETVPKIDPNWLTKAGKYLSYLNPIGSASAEEIDFSKVPGATDKFTPKFDFIEKYSQGVKDYTGTTKQDYIDAVTSGAFGNVAGASSFPRNVGGLFEGVDLNKSGSLFSTTPTFVSHRKGTGSGYIDVDKGSLQQSALDAFPEGFFKAKGGLAGVLPKGKEVDYRGGGVIPIGSRERADDVPARLSKNEFVMTADAVRAAGGGNINQGAKRMYNLMNNLEARV